MVYPSSTPATPNCHPSVHQPKPRSIHLQCQPTILPSSIPSQTLNREIERAPSKNPQQQSKSNPCHSFHPLYRLYERIENYAHCAMYVTYLLSRKLRRVRHRVRSSPTIRATFASPLLLYTPQATHNLLGRGSLGRRTHGCDPLLPSVYP